MKPLLIKPSSGLNGSISIPGDKSISHRAAILASLAPGRTTIRNFLFSEDSSVTLEALRQLGVKVRINKKACEVIIISKGILRRPLKTLWMGESGTSARFFLGLLCAQNFSSKLDAAPSLLKRPMKRVLEPLRKMGACISAKTKGKDEYLPCQIFPASLNGIHWTQKIPSAQVKSAILLAGLFADGDTVVRESVVSRDHTERMLQFFGADIKMNKGLTRIRQSLLRTPGTIVVPCDISSAAFFIVAALLVKHSKVVLKNIGINPTRVGILNVLKRMGGSIKLVHQKNAFEPTADIVVESSVLKGTRINSQEIPSLIDELPIIMVAAGLAKGKTIIQGVQELRVKETDRINSMLTNLLKLGVSIKVKSLKKSENVEITGGNQFKKAALRSFGDHRTAMSMIVAGLAAQGPCFLDDTGCISKSFPDFLSLLKTSS